MKSIQSTMPTLLVTLILLASTTMCSHAFQPAHKISPMRVPNRIEMPPKTIITPTDNRFINFLDSPTLGHRSASATMLRAYKTSNDENGADENTNKPLQNLASSMKKFLSTNFLSIVIFLLPLFLSASDAWAAQSGGRMGGSFGGSSSRSSYSRSYSAPSYSAPSSGYSRCYSPGCSSGYYSRPNVIVSPGISPFYRRVHKTSHNNTFTFITLSFTDLSHILTTLRPFSNPFYSPYYYGNPGGVVVSKGPGFGSIFIFAVFALVAFSALGNITSSVGDSIGSALGSNVQSVLGSGVSAVEISVALNVPDRDNPNSILSALHRLSRTARTDSRVGLQNLTSQVALELLRRKEDIVAVSTSGHNFNDESKAQREFNNMAIQQRSKFQRETVSNYGGVDYSAGEMKRANEYSPKATVAVVTLVMLIDGDSTSKTLSKRVNSIRDVEQALSRIAADSKADNCLRGAEILWTPEERDETLTMRDALADYSSLRNV